MNTRQKQVGDIRNIAEENISVIIASNNVEAYVGHIQRYELHCFRYIFVPTYLRFLSALLGYYTSKCDYYDAGARIRQSLYVYPDIGLVLLPNMNPHVRP